MFRRDYLQPFAAFLVPSLRKAQKRNQRVSRVYHQNGPAVPRSQRGTAELGADFNCCQNSRRLKEAFINICAPRLNYASACGEKPGGGWCVCAFLPRSIFPIVTMAARARLFFFLRGWVSTSKNLAVDNTWFQRKYYSKSNDSVIHFLQRQNVKVDCF